MNACLSVAKFQAKFYTTEIPSAVKEYPQITDNCCELNETLQFFFTAASGSIQLILQAERADSGLEGRVCVNNREINKAEGIKSKKI
jgi:hypothetical protein